MSHAGIEPTPQQLSTTSAPWIKRRLLKVMEDVMNDEVVEADTLVEEENDASSRRLLEYKDTVVKAEENEVVEEYDTVRLAGRRLLGDTDYTQWSTWGICTCLDDSTSEETRTRVCEGTDCDGADEEIRGCVVDCSCKCRGLPSDSETLNQCCFDAGHGGQHQNKIGPASSSTVYY